MPFHLKLPEPHAKSLSRRARVDQAGQAGPSQLGRSGPGGVRGAAVERRSALSMLIPRPRRFSVLSDGGRRRRGGAEGG